MDYQGNSHASREGNPLKRDPKEEKKIEKVISTEVVTRKKPVGRKFREIFFGGDIRSVSHFIAADVVFPSIRNLIADVVIKGMERIVFPDASLSRRRSPSEYRSRTNYSSIVSRPRDPREYRDYKERGVVYLPDQPPYSQRRPRQNIDEIILVSREEAELVVEKLLDIMDVYDVVSVADLYELLGLPSSFVDNKWGWNILHNVEIRQVREGYLINLPSPEAL